MKLKCLACTVGLSILLISSGTAQSTFKFQNLVALGGINAPVFDANGNRLMGTNYAAELWGGISSESLSPMLDLDSHQRVILPFSTGLAAGYFFSTASMTLFEAPGNSFAWAQVRAWDARLGGTYEGVAALGQGGYGVSPLVFARGGDPNGANPSPPGYLTGLQSFSLLPVVPEPAAWVLLALGGTALWAFRRAPRGRL